MLNRVFVPGVFHFNFGDSKDAFHSGFSQVAPFVGTLNILNSAERHCSFHPTEKPHQRHSHTPPEGLQGGCWGALLDKGNKNVTAQRNSIHLPIVYYPAIVRRICHDPSTIDPLAWTKVVQFFVALIAVAKGNNNLEISSESSPALTR